MVVKTVGSCSVLVSYEMMMVLIEAGGMSRFRDNLVYWIWGCVVFSFFFLLLIR